MPSIANITNRTDRTNITNWTNRTNRNHRTHRTNRNHRTNRTNVTYLSNLTNNNWPKQHDTTLTTLSSLTGQIKLGQAQIVEFNWTEFLKVELKKVEFVTSPCFRVRDGAPCKLLLWVSFLWDMPFLPKLKILPSETIST